MSFWTMLLGGLIVVIILEIIRYFTETRPKQKSRYQPLPVPIFENHQDYSLRNVLKYDATGKKIK